MPCVAEPVEPEDGAEVAGAEVTVYGQYEDWYVIHYGGRIGYAAARYIVRK